MKIKVQRPCINECFSEFVPKENILFYALGAIKNVGFEAISQVVKEREKNGKFRSISDFINRVNPKNINKLQLEGLVKAGAFDSIYKNEYRFRLSLQDQILFYHFDDKYNFLKMFWISQGISVIKQKVVTR